MAMNSNFSHDTYLFCLFFYASTLFTACPHTSTGLSFVQMFQKALISPSVWFFKRTSANKRSFLSQDCMYSTLSSLKSAPLKWLGGGGTSSSLVQTWEIFSFCSFAAYIPKYFTQQYSPIIYVFEHSLACLMCSVRLTTVRFSFWESVFGWCQSPSVRSVFLKLSPSSIAPFFSCLEGIKTRMNLSIQKKELTKDKKF